MPLILKLECLFVPLFYYHCAIVNWFISCNTYCNFHFEGTNERSWLRLSFSLSLSLCVCVAFKMTFHRASGQSSQTSVSSTISHATSNSINTASVSENQQQTGKEVLPPPVPMGQKGHKNGHIHTTKSTTTTLSNMEKSLERARDGKETGNALYKRKHFDVRLGERNSIVKYMLQHKDM